MAWEEERAALCASPRRARLRGRHRAAARHRDPAPHSPLTATHPRPRAPQAANPRAMKNAEKLAASTKKPKYPVYEEGGRIVWIRPGMEELIFGSGSGGSISGAAAAAAAAAAAPAAAE
jgi:hypothetical protein